MGAHTTSFGKYNPMWGAFLPLPLPPISLTPQISHMPQISLHPYLSGAILSTYLHLYSLTFFHRPEEAASVWRLQKHVCPKLDYTLCFIKMELI